MFDFFYFILYILTLVVSNETFCLSCWNKRNSETLSFCFSTVAGAADSDEIVVNNGVGALFEDTISAFLLLNVSNSYMDKNTRLICSFC